MNELIEKMCAEANITEEQAQKALEAVANFVKDKFPMMAGAVDKLFQG
jgi:nucleoid DNA-binding protein